MNTNWKMCALESEGQNPFASHNIWIDSFEIIYRKPQNRRPKNANKNEIRIHLKFILHITHDYIGYIGYGKWLLKGKYVLYS